MASEKITFKSIWQAMFAKKIGITKYLLFTLIVLSLGFVSVYLNYTTYYFIGTFILVILLLPLIVTFTEYTALIESGAPFPHNIKGFTTLFQNTYRSGRLRVILTWKVLLGFLAYIFVASFATVIGISIFVALFDQNLINDLRPLIDTILTAESPEALNALVEQMGDLFKGYDLAYTIANQIAITAGVIFILNQGIFRVYASIFIEHQPTTKFETINRQFFTDNATKKTLRHIHSLFNIIVVALYALFYISSVLIIRAINPTALVFLQAELISLIVLVITLPFATRFNFYFYQKVIAPKRVEVLIFALSELRAILQNPQLPEQGKMYISEVIKAREQELSALIGVVDEPSDKSDAVDETVV